MGADRKVAVRRQHGRPALPAFRWDGLTVPRRPPLEDPLYLPAPMTGGSGQASSTSGYFSLPRAGDVVHVAVKPRPACSQRLPVGPRQTRAVSECLVTVSGGALDGGIRVADLTLEQLRTLRGTEVKRVGGVFYEAATAWDLIVGYDFLIKNKMGLQLSGRD